MGRWVTELLEKEFSKRAVLSAVANQRTPVEELLKTDVIIDFSSPEAVLNLVRVMAASESESLPALVVGSTGWKIDGRKELEALAKNTPVIMSSNFSTGVLAVLEILKSASPLLEKLGYSPVIVETHHKHKKDAPSGTALLLQKAIASHGQSNTPIHSVRGGEIIGDHDSTYYGDADHITRGHFAQRHSYCARGATEAALWLVENRRSSSSFSGLMGMDAFFKERFI